jgi:hypothetical protein
MKFNPGTPLGDMDTVKVTKGVKKKVGPAKEGEAETVIFVEPSIDGVLPTAIAFKELEQTVSKTKRFPLSGHIIHTVRR